jgi:ankyrin repeat protein
LESDDAHTCEQALVALRKLPWKPKDDETGLKYFNKILEIDGLLYSDITQLAEITDLYKETKNPKLIDLLDKAMDHSEKSVRDIAKEGLVFEELVKRRDAKFVLHKAVDKGELKAINELLDRGEDINRRNDDGLSPLHIAAFPFYGGVETEVIEFLLKKKADVHARDYEGETVFHKIANIGVSSEYQKNLLRKKIQLFLDYGGDINQVNSYGKRPSDKANDMGNWSTAEILVVYENM